MRSLLLSMIVAVASLVVAPHAAWSGPEVGVRSYKEWKTTKVFNAQLKISSLRQRLAYRRNDPNLARLQNPAVGSTEAGRDAESLRLEAQIRLETNALETAQELTVSDYFAGYLAKMNDRDAAFKSVAGRLTAEEVAELMAAYANSLFGTPSPRTAPAPARLTSETVK